MNYFQKSIAKIAALSLVVVASSCLEEIDDLDKLAEYTWNPQLAVPLANSNFSFGDFVTNFDSLTQVSIDNEGLISILYHTDFISARGSDIFTDLGQTLTLTPVSASIPGILLSQLPVLGSITFTQDITVALNSPSGEAIDSVWLNSGNLIINIDWGFATAGSFTITLTSVSSNSRTVLINNNFTSADFMFSDNIDLSGATLDLTDNGVTSNTFSFSLEITLQDPGAPVTSGDFNLTFDFQNPVFKGIFGNLGADKDIFSARDTIDLKFFDNIIGGTFFLENPMFNFTFKNSYGLPIAIKLGQLTVSSLINGTGELTGSITDTLNLPTITAPDFSGIGTDAVSKIEVNNTVSNVANLLELLPNKLIYRFEGILNPGGAVPQNFVLDTSNVKIGLDVELPIHGRVNNLIASNEFEFDGETFNDIDLALFRIETDNGFPFEVNIQVYFLDSTNTKIDSLVTTDPAFFSAAPVDGNGIVTASVIKTTDIEMTDSKLRKLESSTTKIRVEAVMNSNPTNPTQSVKVLESYKLQINIGVQTEFAISTG